MIEDNIHHPADTAAVGKEARPREGIAPDIDSDAAWDLFFAELHDSSRPDDPPAVFATPAAGRLLSLAFEFGPQIQEAVSR